MKRSLIQFDDLVIDVSESRNHIFVGDPRQLQDMCPIPNEAVYFSGSLEQFIDLMKRMKKKYGHLYGRSGDGG